MLKTHKKNTILFPAVLFCIFAFCSFLILIYGINAYQKIQDTGDRVFQQNTPLSYLTNKVRAHDEVGKVSIETIQNVDCLVLTVNNQDELYRNLIYVKDGELCELLIPNDRQVDFQEGTRIMKVNHITMKQDQNQIIFRLQTGDETLKRQVYIHSY